MSNLDWTKRPVRNIHITVREPDVADFEPSRFVDWLADIDCNFVSLLTAGYHAIYRSGLPLVRINPFLGDRDILGELVDLCHKSVIKVGACIDVGAATREVYEHHPDWFCVDSQGRPHTINPRPVELLTACPLGGYINGLMMPLVQEHLDRYDFDHFNLTGLGWDMYGAGPCHCHVCTTRFREAHGMEIPDKIVPGDPRCRTFLSWRAAAGETANSEAIAKMKAMKPGLATWINQGYDISSTPYAPIERLSQDQDFVKTEAQSKVLFNSLDEGVRYTPMFLPAEEGRYLNTLTDKQVITTTSYYYAWPWRKSAVPYAMQMMWIAEAAANGVSPFVHISGFPQNLEDRRGLAAVSEMFRFLARHERYFGDVESYVNTAIILSQSTLNMHAGGSIQENYSQHYRGAYALLAHNHVPFDILAEVRLSRAVLEKYRLIVLPNHAAMSDETAALLRSFVKEGGRLLATYETSLYDTDGAPRSDFALADVFGCHLTGTRIGPLAGRSPWPVKMAYAYLSGDHPITANLGETELVPMAGLLPVVAPDHGTIVPLTGQLPINVFPEGEAWSGIKPEIPAALVRDHGKGRVVFFPGMFDRLYDLFLFPDYLTIARGAVGWLLEDESVVELEAPRTVDVMTQRHKDGDVIVHLINLTGIRPHCEIIPVSDVGIRLRPPTGASYSKATVMRTGQELPLTSSGPWLQTRLPRLDVYEPVIFS